MSSKAKKPRSESPASLCSHQTTIRYDWRHALWHAPRLRGLLKCISQTKQNWFAPRTPHERRARWVVGCRRCIDSADHAGRHMNARIAGLGGEPRSRVAREQNGVKPEKVHIGVNRACVH